MKALFYKWFQSKVFLQGSLLASLDQYCFENSFPSQLPVPENFAGIQKKSHILCRYRHLFCRRGNLIPHHRIFLPEQDCL